MIDRLLPVLGTIWAPAGHGLGIPGHDFKFPAWALTPLPGTGGCVPASQSAFPAPRDAEPPVQRR